MVDVDRAPVAHSLFDDVVEWRRGCAKRAIDRGEDELNAIEAGYGARGAS
jgi:hypothetical protein